MCLKKGLMKLMDTLSFAAGYALGRKKGGGDGGSSFFQKILRNSTFANEIEIDSKFTFKIALWLTDELPLWYSGIDLYENIHENSDGTKSFVFRHRKSLHKFCIAYEDGKPLYASDMEGEQGAVNQHDVRRVGTQDNYKWCYCTIQENASLGDVTPYGNPYLIFSGGSFGHSFGYSSDISAVVNINHYGINQTSASDMPTIFLAGVEPRTYTGIGNTSTYPNTYGTYSDISGKEVLDKYAEIVRHIYIANGVPCVEPLIAEYEE